MAGHVTGPKTFTAPGTGFYRPPDRRHQYVREPRCGSDDARDGPEGCGRMLARFITKPARIDCPRCKRANVWGEVPSQKTTG